MDPTSDPYHTLLRVRVRLMVRVMVMVIVIVMSRVRVRVSVRVGVRLIIHTYICVCDIVDLLKSNCACSHRMYSITCIRNSLLTALAESPIAEPPRADVSNALDKRNGLGQGWG